MDEERIEWKDRAVYEEPGKSSQSSMALASLVMGIVGIVTSCCCYGGLIFGSLGILFSLLSKTEKRMEGYAKAGMITSVIALFMAVVAAIGTIVFIIMEGLTMGGIFW